MAKSAQTKPKSKPAKSSKSLPAKQVKFIQGATDILVIAPHGVRVKGVKNDDTNTAILARKIANKLECSALINDSIKRTEVDYNSITSAEADKAFFKNLCSVLDSAGPTLVVWIHGIGTKSLSDEKTAMGFTDRLDCLVGFGQPDRHSIREADVDTLISLLEKNEVTTRKTRDDADDYRGWAKDNMNQWFRQEKKYNDLDKVQSVQLEFSGGKRRKDLVEQTAKSISTALSALVRPVVDDTEKEVVTEPIEVEIVEENPDIALVDRAYTKLAEIFSRHFGNALLEAGEYIFKTFYSSDIQAVRSKNPLKPQSYNRLRERLNQSDDVVPSRSWLNNAVNLHIDNLEIKKLTSKDTDTVHTYGQLTAHHKIQILRLDKQKDKIKFINKTINKKTNKRLSVLKLKEAIDKHLDHESKPPGLVQLIHRPEKLFSKDNSGMMDDEYLSRFRLTTIESLQTQAKEIVKLQREYITKYQDLIKTLNQTAKQKRIDAPKVPPKSAAVKPKGDSNA